MPDLFNGDAVPLNRPGDFDIMAWLKNGHESPSVDPIVDSLIVELRTKYKVKKLGAVGYCFGGKYAVRHLRPDAGKIDVAYTAHPSFVDEEEVLDIKGPLSIAAAEEDSIFPAERRHKTEELLIKVGQPYQINLYSGVEHGFAVRGDLNKQAARYAKESAFLQAVQFFEEYLK